MTEQLISVDVDESVVVASFTVGRGEILHDCEEHGSDISSVKTLVITNGAGVTQYYLFTPESWDALCEMVTTERMLDN